MEIKPKKYSLGKKIAIFLLSCIVLSTILKASFKYYFDNNWYPGIEKNITTGCKDNLTRRETSGDQISTDAITAYCNCYLEKIKSKYKPKELSSISKKEYKILANECIQIIKDSSVVQSSQEH